MRFFAIILLVSVCILAFFLVSPDKPQTQPAELLKTSGARQALDYLTNARAYPAKSFPQSGIADAFAVMRKDLSKQNLLNSVQELDPWRAIGPHNIGGRTLAIAVNPQNPNTIYAGSASGGLWRSYTAGEGDNAWEYVSTGFPVLGVSSIAIAPDDSNVIYIGTGEVYGSPVTFPGITGDRTTRGSYGIGILKSTDGGRTWQKSLDWLFQQQRGVQMVRINPRRPATVWAATTEGTYRSYDSGLTWQSVHQVVMATDLEINPADTNTVFVGAGGMGSPGHGIYRTRDGGTTWQKANIPGVVTFRGKVRLAISQSSPNIVYASIGKSSGSLFTNEATGTWLAKTVDSGDSWSVVSSVDYSRIQGWYAHDVAVHPTNPDLVWTAGQPFSPYRSTSGGTFLSTAQSQGYFQGDAQNRARGLPDSWADFHHIVYDPTDPDIMYFANDGGVFRSTDGGRTVRNCSYGYQTTQFYNGTSSSYSDSLMTIGGLQDNNSAIYEGQVSWRRLYCCDGGWTAIHQSDNNVIYVSGQFLSIGKSNTRGISGFQQLNLPGLEARLTNFIAPYVLGPDNLTMYAGSNIVFKSVDGGTTWSKANGGQPLDTNPLIAMAISEQSIDVVYAATSPGDSRGRLFRTGNGGLSWSDITGDLPDRFPTDLAVDPTDDQVVYATLGGFGSSHVFRSINSGASWEDIGAGLPDVPTWAVIVDPDFPQQLFVGSDLGVYFSPDLGQTWQAHMAELPDAVIAMDLTIARANRVLRVATHGNGFYESRLPLGQPTSVTDDRVSLPRSFVLEQNYPNPFNLETRIKYYLQRRGEVELRIYNSLGQQVRIFADEIQSEGWHIATWDGRNGSGEIVSSGVYVYRLIAGGQSLERKMILLK